MGFSDKLSHLMGKAGISNYRLAKEISAHPTSVKNWREGVCHPSMKKMVAISRFFGCSVDELIAGER